MNTGNQVQVVTAGAITPFLALLTPSVVQIPGAAGSVPNVVVWRSLLLNPFLCLLLPLPTEAEQGLFKRNSRLFVVETGKAISLKQKFNISRPAQLPPLHSPSSWSEAGGADGGFGDAAPLPVTPPLKPHYAEARSALFESDLHLDAAGEHPR